MLRWRLASRLAPGSRRTPNAERLGSGQIPSTVIWEKVESLDRAVNELSAESVDDMAAVMRAVIRRQPIPADRVVRLAYLGAQWLGMALYRSVMRKSTPRVSEGFHAGRLSGGPSD